MLSESHKRDLVITFVRCDGVTPEQVVEKAAAGCPGVEPFDLTTADVQRYLAEGEAEEAELTEAFAGDPLAGYEAAVTEVARESLERLLLARRRARTGLSDATLPLQRELKVSRSAGAMLRMLGRSVPRPGEDDSDDESPGDGLSDEADATARLLRAHLSTRAASAPKPRGRKALAAPAPIEAATKVQTAAPAGVGLSAEALELAAQLAAEPPPKGEKLKELTAAFAAALTQGRIAA
jgi:hypothetical protein